MKRDELLEKAKRIVCGDRDLQYGEPEDSFRYIAEFWSTYLGVGIDRVDVANMMILLKVARTLASRKDDNYVDIAGYAACAAEVAEAAVEAADPVIQSLSKDPNHPELCCNDCMYRETPATEEPCWSCTGEVKVAGPTCTRCVYRNVGVASEPCVSCDFDTCSNFREAMEDKDAKEED